MSNSRLSLKINRSSEEPHLLGDMALVVVVRRLRRSSLAMRCQPQAFRLGAKHLSHLSAHVDQDAT